MFSPYPRPSLDEAPIASASARANALLVPPNDDDLPKRVPHFVGSRPIVSAAAAAAVGDDGAVDGGGAESGGGDGAGGGGDRSQSARATRYHNDAW